MLLITKAATPSSEVQIPLADRSGGGGVGSTQVVISTTVVNQASLGVEKEYPVDEPVTVNVMLCPASSDTVPV